MEPETVSEGWPSTGSARAAAILALLLFGVASAVAAQSPDLSGPPIELGYLAISPPDAGGVALLGTTIAPNRERLFHGAALLRVGPAWADYKSVHFELVDTREGYIGGAYREERLPRRLGIAGDAAAALELTVPTRRRRVLGFALGIGAFFSYFPAISETPELPDKIEDRPIEDFRISYPVKTFPRLIPLARVRLSVAGESGFGFFFDGGVMPKYATVSAGLLLKILD